MSRAFTRNWVLLSVGLGFLLVAWVFATRPFAAPDESAHYLHALGIANGTLLGPKVNTNASKTDQTAFISQDARGVLVDAKDAPPGAYCVSLRALPVKGRCVAASYEGNFQPLPYLLPAAATKISATPHQGLWLGRLASAAVCFAFLVLALRLLDDDPPWMTLGLLLAITPTTLFVSSVINPNGLEIAANLAFVAFLMRLVRGEPVWRWTWIGAAISGAVVVLSWQLGWIFVAADLLAIGAIAGRKRALELFHGHRNAIKWMGVALVASLALYLAWAAVAQLLHGTVRISPLGRGLSDGLSELRVVLYGAVAIFGRLDVALPADGYYWTWWILIAAMLGAAILTGSQRQRVALTAITVCALAFPVLFYAWVQRYSGFGLQARHVMPELALIPLAAGAVLAQWRARLPDFLVALIPGIVIAIVAAYQLFAWWINAQSSAGRRSSFWFGAHAQWSPTIGWPLWTAIAVLGTSLLFVVAARALWHGRSALAGSPQERLTLTT